MNTRFFASGFVAVALVPAIFAAPMHAQKNTTKANLNSTIAGDAALIKANTMTGAWGERHLVLDGAAKIQHPQLDVAAGKIIVDFDDKRDPTTVNATGGVQFKISLSQKNGTPVRIEAKCDNAELTRDPQKRVLTLKGGVDGWFQNGKGPKNQLRGETVTLKSQPDAAVSLVADIRGSAQGIRVDVPPPGNASPDAKPVTITAQNAQLRQAQNGSLDADVDGGAQNVRLEIPPMMDKDKPGEVSLGAVVVTSQRAMVRQSDGSASFTGNAHATSSGEGAAKFDVTADELTLNRMPNGDLSNLKSKGRTRVQLELPANPNAKPLVANSDKSTMGRPNYVEVEANSATADLLKKLLILNGDVKGYYRVPIASATPDAATTTNYPFRGVEQAEISYSSTAGTTAQGFDVNLKRSVEEQVTITIPDFGFNGF